MAGSSDAEVTGGMTENEIRPKPLLDEFFARLKRDADRLAGHRASFVRVGCGFCGGGGRHAFDKDGFSYAECVACRSLFVDPRPAAEALADFARRSEAVAFWSSHFYRETAAARRERIFRPRARAVVEAARAHGLGDMLRFADVGAGYGLFLAELRAAAPRWSLTGIEPDARLAAACREEGFDAVERWIEEMRDEEGGFDFVSAFEVLEHVFDPLAFLAACRRLVRPGGFVLVTTLTISGFDLQVLWNESRSITPPQHLNFPSVGAVDRCAARAGFEVVELTTPGRLDVDIVRNVCRERPEAVRDRFAQAIAGAPDEVRQAFQQFLASHRLSSHLRCLLRRPA
ncbi:MAG: class I SAM-dependent methyltransferase [Acidobacteria bacterium]|nr:class I SAM-dependent methyltransferase [Acidobacteriota bacterium]